MTILRGVIDRMPTAGARPAKPGVLAVGGGGRSRGSSSADLFGLSNDEEFNRIAEAVHGIESRYGTDARMWRLDNLDGPQGPMQVSAAAAVDVGGGDRFDVYENLLLGRAYLARLLWKYDSWPDALAAYNWGPGNVDQWIARGRNAAQLPAETTRYIALVMRRASLGSIAGTVQQRIPKP
ncbi:MAG: lytic transglycosylase domain-containing protein [Alphaproteobacteria bacterium]